MRKIFANCGLATSSISVLLDTISLIIGRIGFFALKMRKAAKSDLATLALKMFMWAAWPGKAVVLKNFRPSACPFMILKSEIMH